MNANELIFLASLLWLLFFSVRFGFGLLNRELALLNGAFHRNTRLREERSAELKKMKEERIYLERKLTDLAGLYNITKEMSSDIRFNEMFNSSKNFLEDNFRFARFMIILLKGDSDKKAIDRIYEVSKKEAGFLKEISPAARNITDFLMDKKKPLFLSEEREFADFGFDSGRKNIFAIPLILRKNITSLFLIEDAEEENRDKYLVLAPQIALQIERIRLFEEVERLSITDGLTGVFLRRYFFGRLGEELLRSAKSKAPLSFIMADLDNFKKCNDSFGHLVGDAVLKEVAAAIKMNVREIDLVARYGGEEFCVLLPETNKEGAYAVGERIRKSIEGMTIKAYDESLKITISMGISSFPEDSTKPNGIPLIEKADKALYKAKSEGRNRVVSA